MKVMKVDLFRLLFLIIILTEIALFQTWAEQSVLTAGNYWGDFGRSVSLTDNYALVGAEYSDFSSLIDAGAAYVFVRSGSTWNQQAILTASNKAAGDLFAVSVSLTDNHALIGAWLANPDSINDAGAAYIFVRSGTTWSQQQILTAREKEVSGHFGFCVSVTDAYALIGAHYANPGSVVDAGAAYVFVRSGSTWNQQAILTASDKATNGQFGISVSLTNNYALVGARQCCHYCNCATYGSAYVYVRNGENWSQQSILSASNRQLNDMFGHSVSLTDNYALVGLLRVNRAYVFTRSGSSWIEQQIFDSSCSYRCVHITGNYAIVRDKVFNRSGGIWGFQVLISRESESVSMTDRFILVGDFNAPVDGRNGIGKAYIFRNEATSSYSASFSRSRSQSRSHSYTHSRMQSPPQQEAALHHNTVSVSGSSTKSFGHQIAVYQDILMISKHECEADASSLNCGRVYVMKRQGESWLLSSSLRHPGDVQGRAFGKTFAVRNGWMFISAEPTANLNADSFVYTFKFDDSGSVLRRKRKLHAPDSIMISFGRTLATDGSFVAVGAPLSTTTSRNIESGAVVIYRITSRSSWGKQGSIIQPTSLLANERFGSSLAMSNEGILAVGNRCNDQTCSAVYIFHLRNRQLFVYQKIQYPGILGLGKALAFWEDMLYVSAPEDSTITSNAGSLHVYRPLGSNNFAHVSQIAIENVENSRAGSSICVCESFLLVSRFVCQEEESCSKRGYVDVFSKEADMWTFYRRVSDGVSDGSDRYGTSLACGSDFFAVGAPQSESAMNGGGVHVYRFSS